MLMENNVSTKKCVHTPRQRFVLLFGCLMIQLIWSDYGDCNVKYFWSTRLSLIPKVRFNVSLLNWEPSSRRALFKQLFKDLYTFKLEIFN